MSPSARVIVDLRKSAMHERANISRAKVSRVDSGIDGPSSSLIRRDGITKGWYRNGAVLKFNRVIGDR